MKKRLDYLTPLLEKAPASWALIRANDIKALEKVEFKHPVLDVGCGDGLVAKVLMSSRGGKLDWGIDISEREIKKARRSKSYKNCIVGDVYGLPFPNKTFQTVFSNSVVEHLKDLDKALSEMSRVLKPGGELIITVPSPFLSKYLLGSRFFYFLGAESFAKFYAQFFHFLVRHHHVYNHRDWEKILKKLKLSLANYYYYHSPGIIQAHEVFSYVAIPQYIIRSVTGSWLVFTGMRRIFILPWLKQLFNKLYAGDVSKEEGGSLLLVAKKI